MQYTLAIFSSVEFSVVQYFFFPRYLINCKILEGKKVIKNVCFDLL